MKEKSETAGLNLKKKKKKDHGIWFYHFIANRWGKMETVAEFIFFVFKVTADSYCSHEIKRCSLLEEKLWQS